MIDATAIDGCDHAETRSLVAVQLALEPAILQQAPILFVGYLGDVWVSARLT